MAFFDQIPALVKVFLAFGLILGGYRARVHLGLCLALGAAVLGLLMRMPPAKILTVALATPLDPLVAAVLVIVALILAASRIMSEGGQLKRIVESFSRLIRDVRVVAAVMPALIGLLPMPGGALFSAPMVGAAAEKAGLSAHHKTAINYWFRHIWEYWWPLYPGVILAASLLKVETWRLIAAQFPLTIFAVIAGALFLLKGVGQGEKRAQGETRQGDLGRFLKEAAPILAVILAIPAVTAFELLSGLGLPKHTSVFAGLAACLALAMFQNKTRPPAALRAIFSREVGLMMVLILGIMVFKNVLEASQAVDRIQLEMAAYGIPAVALVMFLPFLSGLITGIAIGFVGASFPLILPLIPASGLDHLAWGMLAYAFGYMGMILSPVHLCLLVTKDYFQASLARSFRVLAAPAALFLALSLGLFLFYLWL